ncbi:MAG: PaaI family thioesterase [Actinomycetota bacterium]
MARTRWDAQQDGTVEIPVNRALGFDVGPIDDPAKEIVYIWSVPAELCNSAGNVQGGVLAAFADSLLGGASAAHLPDDEYPALAEMKISIMRPAAAGTTLTGKGRILKKGRRVLFAEGEVYDADGNLVAKASGTEIPAKLS